ncbi:hypothetical protein ACFLY9_02705 [Patescibacteria group bacterium]
MSPESSTESPSTRPGSELHNLQSGTVFTITLLQSVTARSVSLRVPQPTSGTNNRVVYEFSDGGAELKQNIMYTLVEPSIIVYGTRSPISPNETHLGAIIQNGDNLLFIEETSFGKFMIVLAEQPETQEL